MNNWLCFENGESCWIKFVKLKELGFLTFEWVKEMPTKTSKFSDSIASPVNLETVSQRWVESILFVCSFLKPGDSVLNIEVIPIRHEEEGGDTNYCGRIQLKVRKKDKDLNFVLFISR